METITIKIDDYQPHPENPNTHPVEQIADLEKSLTDYGQFRNVVVWRGHFVAGHGVAEAAQNLGWAELEAVDVSHLDEQEAKKIMVLDNRLPDLAIMDYAMLDQVIKSFDDPVSIPGIDFDYIGEVEGYAFVPDFQPVGADEQPRLDQKNPVICPHCGKNIHDEP